VSEAQIAALTGGRDRNLRDALAELGASAVHTTAPFADNTTAAALRWHGP
jgi:hypothetical protein